MIAISFRWRRVRVLAAVAAVVGLWATTVPASADAVSTRTPMGLIGPGGLRVEPSWLLERRLAAPGTASTATAASSPARTPLASELKARADALVAAGAAATVGRTPDRHGIAHVAAGVEERTSGRRAESDDAFEIGSITKTFMATLTLQLVAERRVRLDDTVERWLPGVVPAGDHITLRMLLNHTSGLYNYTNDPALFEAVSNDPARVFSPQQLVAIATAHAPVFAPGAGWEYSNTNYVVIGMILRAVTGLAPRDLLRLRITGPLHLARTYLADQAPVGDRPHYLHGYLLAYGPDGVAADIDVAGVSLSWGSTAGAMISTTGDLDRFFNALLGGRLLPSAQVKEMETTVPVPNTDARVGYGLGLLRLDTDCGTVWGHDGVTLGHLSAALFTVDGRRGMVSDVSTRPATWGAEPAPGTPDERFLAADTALQRTLICSVFGKPAPQQAPAPQ
ncbi:MAG TPA: serine hydrolase domain-containing protein [Kineosporiaceae bacterium]